LILVQHPSAPNTMRLIYADKRIVTNCLRLAILNPEQVSRTPSPRQWVPTFERETPFRIIRRHDAGVIVETEAVQSPITPLAWWERGRTSVGPLAQRAALQAARWLPEDEWMRIMAPIIEALLAYPEVFAEAGRRLSLRLGDLDPLPGTILFFFTRARVLRLLTAGSSLAEPLNGRTNELRQYFVDPPAKIAPVRPMTIGWWLFDPETQTLINKLSQQRVHFAGAVDDTEESVLHPPARGPVRLRFSYQDPEVTYSVLVTARYDRRSLAWSIDHLGAAAEWRRHTTAAAEAPPYGLWRRVDDALFDALACWPASETAGPRPSRIDSWGGWLNGAWSPRLRRVSVGREKDEAVVETDIEPYLEPLASEPLSWDFVPSENATAGVTLAGIDTVCAELSFLSAEAPLTGFETLIPHLRRRDGKAVMFPYAVRSSLDRDGFYRARGQFFYADEEVFFRLDGCSSEGGLGTWEFDLSELLGFGVRRADAELEKWRTTLVRHRKIYNWRGPVLQPMPRLEQRLTVALIDGWLAWNGSPLRLLDSPKQLERLAGQGSPEPVPPLAKSGFDLAAKQRVAVTSRYHGGRFAGCTTTGYLQRDERSEPSYPLRFG
jgi:hypothetical protein